LQTSCLANQIWATLTILKCLKSQKRHGLYRQWHSNWEKMLQDGTYMTDDEFLSNFHMDRSCVMQLNRLVLNDEAFRSVYGKVARRSSMLHIMVLLKFLGYGNAAALQKIGHMMGVSKGLVNDYVIRACNAILKHHNQVIKWPNKEEHRNISGRIRKVHGFVNCIGVIDGTLFPLAFSSIVNGEY